MWKWIITEEHVGMFIKDFLAVAAQFSKRLIIKAKSPAGKILVNGEWQTVRYQLNLGDVLEVDFPDEIPAEGMKKEKMPLRIVYEDDTVLLLNKPACIATIPSRHHPNGTIANGLLYYYGEKQIQSTIHVVTRLDRDTSGLLLIAKCQYSHSLLSNLQRENLITRKYTAIVSGSLKQEEGIIQKSIGRKAGSIMERTVTDDGQYAVTYYRVLERFANATLIEVTLGTGRTHQIRVHFSSIGHPLLGDNLYGGDMMHMDRHALHCSQLSFQHPFLQKKLDFTVPLPSDLTNVLSIL